MDGRENKPIAGFRSWRARRNMDGSPQAFGVSLTARSSIRFAAEGKADAPWQMKHRRKSPRYTSAWDDLPIVQSRRG